MALTKSARSKILALVQEAKGLLMKEVEELLQQYYGVRPDGTVLMIEQLTTSDSDFIYTARVLRKRLDYIKTNLPDKKNEDVEAVRQLVREQAFTILNRFSSLRMAEERGIIKETVRKEYNSEGFQVFDSITGQGQTASQYIRYKWYIHAIFDELALDLPSVFDRFSPYALIFPSEQVMNRLLDIINREELTIHREEGLQPVNLWKEDETIGWIYQYYNSREEISAMRDASSAPRNSQELAVRNQFFTPRYVVQFLTDNSLGRIWYEMTEGNTFLKSLCSYLIVRPEEVFLRKGESKPEISDENTLYVEYRAIKDPREILMLDPACGSMHFGLYCFDLFEHIYTEAWDNYPELLTDLRNSMTRSDFVKRIPELIIRHNIHGVDIDPRALQIAGLSLWLRAQKSFDKQNLSANQRPQITRSNLVLAEPMPGSIETLSQLVQPLDAPMRKLVLAIWDKMKIAGETGLLLRIEDDIDKTINQISKELADGKMSSQLSIGADDSKLKAAEKAALYSTKQYREHFLNTAEAEVLKMLKQLAETATDGDAYQKLLFADDTARGFAFIELCRKRYDVVLMNPPFGLGVKNNFEWLKVQYPDSYIDLLAAFVERGSELSNSHIGSITSRSILVTPKLERIRKNLLISHFSAIVDLGSPVMDNAMVQSAAYVLRKSIYDKNIVIIDRKQHQDKNYNLAESLSGNCIDDFRYFVNRDVFFSTPRFKLLYNLPLNVLKMFKSNEIFLEKSILAKTGMKSYDDFRFVRIRHEVLSDKIGFDRKWRSYSKGGEYSMYYTDLKVLVMYDRDGLEVQEINRVKFGMTAQARQASTFYYRSGGNFSRRCKDFGVRILPKEFVVGEKGPIIISENNEISNILLIGLLNSSFFNYLVNIQANANQYDTGIIESLPFVEINFEKKELIEKYVIKSINSLKIIDSFKEESAIFQTLPIGKSINQISDNYKKAATHAKETIEITLKTTDEILDQLLGFNTFNLLEKISDFKEEDDLAPLSYSERAMSVTSIPDQVELAHRIISYSFGVLCGRWHHPSEGIRVIFNELNVFENFNNRIIALCDKKSTDIILEQVLNQDNIRFEKEFLQILKSIWESDNLSFELLNTISFNSFSSYFINPLGFFNSHLNLYTASRRAAPIYWPISSNSGTYTIWLYYPKMNDQTLFKVVNDYILPKQQEVAEQIKKLENNPDLDNKGKKELTDSQNLFHELKDMEKDLLEVAALPYKPNHDDGVLITAAPLYKFFRHSKWKKATEECWKALQKGEYDWAHLAYSIWPERVTQKCKKDLSMAIAHGLEETCEVKPKEKKEKKVAKTTNKNIQGKLID